MPETKAFKNVTISKYAGPEAHWRIYPSDGSPISQLLVSDYDMEVTFTKKVKPPKFKAGDRVDLLIVEPEEMGLEPGTVVGYAENKVGVVWDMNVYVGREYPIHWMLEDDLKHI